MSGTLVVAGTAGSVIVAKINSNSVEKDIEVLDILIVTFYVLNLCWQCYSVALVDIRRYDRLTAIIT
jgi:hypothetical protein